MNFRSFNPGGISVEVTFPRWPLRLAQLLIGLGLVAILLLVGLALVFRGVRSSTDFSEAMGVTVVSRDAQGVHAEVTITRADSGNLQLDGWSLLLDDGDIAPGVVRNAAGALNLGDHAEFTVDFALPAGAKPVWLRFSAKDRPTLSIPIRTKAAP